jgi:hypothetical protein
MTEEERTQLRMRRERQFRIGSGSRDMRLREFETPLLFFPTDLGRLIKPSPLPPSHPSLTI